MLVRSVFIKYANEYKNCQSSTSVVLMEMDEYLFDNIYIYLKESLDFMVHSPRNRITSERTLQIKSPTVFVNAHICTFNDIIQ